MSARSFLLLILLSFPTFTHAQVVLGIAEGVTQKKSPSIFISQIVDSTSSRIIGKVFLANKNKTPVRLSLDADQYFTGLATKMQNYDPNKDSIIAVINQVSLHELSSGNVVNGRLRLAVSYYRKNFNEENLLLRKLSMGNYNRSFGSATPKSFEKIIATTFSKNIDFFNSWVKLNQARHPAFIDSSEVIIKPAYKLNVPDTVYYGSRPITWDDFKGETANRNPRFAAAIFPNIAFDLEMEIQNRKLIAHFTPKVYMVQGMSWVKSTNRIDYALQHEQLHFDIAQVAMNRLTERLRKIKSNSPEELQSRIQFEYLEAYREMNRLQKLYDEETRHGLNEYTQAFWQVEIKNWLKE